MWMESNLSLQTCAKAGLSLQHHRSSFQPSCLAFPQLLKHDTDIVVSYYIVPYFQRCYALLVTSNPVHDY